MTLDFDQLAFIEKWRAHAARGSVVALDGRRGDILLTVRVGDLGPAIDLRGRDATGAVRRARLTLGDRVAVAIEYVAADAAPGSGERSVSGGLVAPGASVEGIVSSIGDVAVVDCGAEVLVRADSLAGIAEGEPVRFTVKEEGKAHLIPGR